MSASLTLGRERALLFTLAGIQFSHIVDFMMMMPLGPFITSGFGIGPAEFGILVSAYTFSAGASGVLAATYIDRFDRKRLMLVLYALFAVFTALCGWSSSMAGLMAARVGAGFFGGVLSALSQTIVADVIPFERRGRAMGVVMTSFAVGTVMGVPSALFLANHWGWHSPFFAVAGVSLLLLALAAWLMPALNHHVQAVREQSVTKVLKRTLADRNHQRALLMSAGMMFSSFCVIPYITLYYQGNGILTSAQLPLLYLCGGLATLITSRWVGALADRMGKLKMLRVMLLVSTVPLMITTLMQPWGLGVALAASTLFFIAMNGRMVPAMAVLSAAAHPQLRGTFMTLNGSMQSLAMGLASVVGGMLVTQQADGRLGNYWHAGILGVIGSGVTFWLAGRVTMHTQPVSR
ncbi:MAG: Purine efflux pump PbuE [Pseudomonadota bacterium]